MSVPLRRVEIFTDGSCLGNPGPGGWGAVLLSYSGSDLLKRKEIAGMAAHTTNNRMELLAPIKALKALKNKHDRTVVVNSDSQYVVRGMNEWLLGWKRRDWRKASGKRVEHADLWQTLEALSDEHKAQWRWVKAHVGNPMNERADALANDQAQTAKLIGKLEQTD